MIFDTIDHAARYYGLGEKFKKALMFLENYSGDASEPSTIVLDEDIRIISMSYTTKPQQACVFEAHEKYVDIHFVVSGDEAIGCADRKDMTVTKADKEHDVFFLEGTGKPVSLKKGDFMITFPWDAHMPGIMTDKSRLCRKLVVKIRY
ncbi:MAG: YhcH/YjgK/YiaL family protein [Clostridia bacterium]|nr:YhcH/YjgK/YiaL family protein [Clostridia bacterium]